MKNFYPTTNIIKSLNPIISNLIDVLDGACCFAVKHIQSLYIVFGIFLTRRNFSFSIEKKVDDIPLHTGITGASFRKLETGLGILNLFNSKIPQSFLEKGILELTYARDQFAS